MQLVPLHVGAPIDRDDNFTLQKILDMHAPDYAEEIAAISTEATQESALEELLNKVGRCRLNQVDP
jgi:dynein heavy chain